jgi:hypothetical protein
MLHLEMEFVEHEEEEVLKALAHMAERFGQRI